MTRDEFDSQFYAAMRARFPGYRFAKATLDAYFADLEELLIDNALAGFRSLYRDGTDHPPNGGKIFQRACELRRAATQRQPELEDLDRARELWHRAIQAMGPDVISQSAREIWLKPLVPLGFNAGVLYLGADDDSADWVQRRFTLLLDKLMRKLDDSVEGARIVQHEGARLEVVA